MTPQLRVNLHDEPRAAIVITEYGCRRLWCRATMLGTDYSQLNQPREHCRHCGDRLVRRVRTFGAFPCPRCGVTVFTHDNHCAQCGRAIRRADWRTAQRLAAPILARLAGGKP